MGIIDTLVEVGEDVVLPGLLSIATAYAKKEIDARAAAQQAIELAVATGVDQADLSRFLQDATAALAEKALRAGQQAEYGASEGGG